MTTKFHVEIIPGPQTHKVMIVQIEDGQMVSGTECSLKEAEQLCNDLKAMLDAFFEERLIHGACE